MNLEPVSQVILQMPEAFECKIIIKIYILFSWDLRDNFNLRNQFFIGFAAVNVRDIL